MISISKSSKRIGKLAIAGLVAGIGTSATTSPAIAENYIGGQTYGIRKCARAVLHGYEVKGVDIRGHKFNCKGMARFRSGWRWVQLSHAQHGIDDQINFVFQVNSNNVFKKDTLKESTDKGFSMQSIKNAIVPHFDGVSGPIRTYEGFVAYARKLKTWTGENKRWNYSAQNAIAVIIAELGNPENRGTAPRGVPCDLPTVYVHDNYTGSKLRLNDGPDPDLHDNGGKFADSISSICVPRGWVVRAFEDKTYKGRKLEIVGPKRYEDLKRQIGWGDRISSIAAFRQR